MFDSSGCQTSPCGGKVAIIIAVIDIAFRLRSLFSDLVLCFSLSDWLYK